MRIVASRLFFFAEFKPPHFFLVDNAYEVVVAGGFFGNVGDLLAAVEECVEFGFFLVQRVEFGGECLKFFLFLEREFVGVLLA